MNERIAVNLQPISSLALDSLAEKWQPVISAASSRGPGALTHFEVLTSLMLAHFAEHQAGSQLQIQFLLNHFKPMSSCFSA